MLYLTQILIKLFWARQQAVLGGDKLLGGRRHLA